MELKKMLLEDSHHAMLLIVSVVITVSSVVDCATFLYIPGKRITGL